MTTLTAERPTSPAAVGPRDNLRPFGLTKAVPVTVTDTPADLPPVLTLCLDRQISVTEDGVPFIHEPSMATALTTTQQTQEDSQLDTSNENDTD